MLKYQTWNYWTSRFQALYPTCKTCDPCGETCFDSTSTFWTNFEDDNSTIMHTNYKSSWHVCFREDNFQKFFYFQHCLLTFYSDSGGDVVWKNCLQTHECTDALTEAITTNDGHYDIPAAHYEHVVLMWAYNKNVPDNNVNIIFIWTW